MKKRKAFRLAKKFRNDHPELADRPLRVGLYASQGYNAYTVIKRVRIGPRGGMGEARRVSTLTQGSMGVNVVRSGDTLMRVDYVNGWPKYDSWIALPHDETSAYASNGWKPQFSVEEKITSIEWALKNVPDPHGELRGQLAYMLDELETRKVWEDEMGEAW